MPLDPVKRAQAMESRRKFSAGRKKTSFLLIFWFFERVGSVPSSVKISNGTENFYLKLFCKVLVIF